MVNILFSFILPICILGKNPIVGLPTPNYVLKLNVTAKIQKITVIVE